jgi:phosphohistidine phosphatase
MKLFLMRHGDAQQAKKDSDRELSPLGIEQSKAMAIHFKNEKLSHLYSSDFLRAQQTVKNLQAALGQEIPIELSEYLRPSTDTVRSFDYILDAFDRLDNENASMLMVSHLPLLSDLCSLAIKGRVGQDFAFAPGAIALLEADYPDEGTFELKWIKSPAINN